MLNKMQNRLRIFGTQIRTSWRAAGRKITAYPRTELTWARVIGSYHSVPNGYQEFFSRYKSAGQEFPYTVFTPAFQTLGYRITEKLVVALHDRVTFLEKIGDTLIEKAYPLEEISHVEMSSMLLDSRVKVSGAIGKGVLTSSLVRFSSSTDYLFAPILKRIRLQGAESNGLVPNVELSTFDGWIERNFKFMNLARHSIIEGEQVIQAILQPEIRVSRFKFLAGRFYRTISPTHACILTNRELILIREEALQGRKDKYGAIWDYIPLNKIAGFSMNKRNGTLLALSIQLLTNESFECLFEASMENEVDQLLARIQELTPRLRADSDAG